MKRQTKSKAKAIPVLVATKAKDDVLDKRDEDNIVIEEDDVIDDPSEDEVEKQPTKKLTKKQERARALLETKIPIQPVEKFPEDEFPFEKGRDARKGKTKKGSQRQIKDE